MSNGGAIFFFVQANSKSKEILHSEALDVRGMEEETSAMEQEAQ